MPVYIETKDASVQREELVKTCDAFTQTDEVSDAEATATDELAEDLVPAEQDCLCEGNNDAKFHPLVMKGTYVIIIYLRWRSSDSPRN